MIENYVKIEKEKLTIQIQPFEEEIKRLKEESETKINEMLNKKK